MLPPALVCAFLHSGLLLCFLAFGIAQKKLEPLFSISDVFKYQIQISFKYLLQIKLQVKKILPALRKLFLGQKYMAEVETFQHLRLQMAEAVLQRSRQNAIREIADWQDIWQEISWAVMNQNVPWPAAFSPRQPRQLPQPRESPTLHDCSGKTGTHVQLQESLGATRTSTVS